MSLESRIVENFDMVRRYKKFAKIQRIIGYIPVVSFFTIPAIIFNIDVNISFWVRLWFFGIQISTATTSLIMAYRQSKLD